MEKTFKVKSENGLHARPAANFVRVAATIPVDVKITCNGKTSDAKSIMGVMGLRIVKDSDIELFVDSNDETYMTKLESHLVENNII